MRTFWVMIVACVCFTPAYAVIGPAPEGVAAAQYDPITGEFVVSSGGVVNLYLESSGTLLTLGSPAPTPPIGSLISYNRKRVGLSSLAGIDVTNFSFGSIGANLPLDDLSFKYNPAFGFPAVTLPAIRQGDFYVFGESASSSFIADPRSGSTLAFSFPQPNRSVSLLNKDSQPISVEALELTGPDAGLFRLSTPQLPFSLDSTHPYQLDITYTAEVPAKIDPSAKVAIALSNGQTLEYSLAAKHPLTVTPLPGSSIYLGSVLDGENATIVRNNALVIENDSSIPFDVTSVSIEGPDAAFFSTQGPTLPHVILPTDPFRLGVTFAPSDTSSSRPYDAILRVAIGDGQTLSYDIAANLVSLPTESKIRALYDPFTGVLHIDSDGIVNFFVSHKLGALTPTAADLAPAGTLATLNSSRVGLAALGLITASWSVNIGSGLNPSDLVLTYTERLGAPAYTAGCGTVSFSCAPLPEPSLSHALLPATLIIRASSRLSRLRRVQGAA